MSTTSALILTALVVALVAVLVWGFRRAGDGPETPIESDQDAERR
ncbi:hypothetical protein [Amycolatopsis sp. H20-H5]|nr:hypothetical protein [Amycolatopsis sp. H20-H5]MEC3979951.1 hypothetical protein [Amycolatopsis sp. H20-H5]